MKNYIQILNPRTERWVKIDTDTGEVVSHKKTKGKYNNTKEYD